MPQTSVRVAMHCLGCERGHAHRDVLGATGLGTAVAHPSAWMRDDCLAGPHIERAALVLDSQDTAQHERNLLELRSLSRLGPAFGRDHTGDADAAMPGVHSSRVF